MKIIQIGFVALTVFFSVTSQADLRGLRPGAPPAYNPRNPPPLEARLNLNVRGSARVPLTRYLNLNRYEGYEIESLVIRGRSERGFTDLYLINGGQNIGQTYLQQTPYLTEARLYPSYQSVIRRGVEVNLEVRGYAQIDSVVLTLRSSYNPPYPPPHDPYDRYVQIDCNSYKPLSAECSPGGYIVSVRLLRQNSNSECRYGSSWFYDSSKITVSKGCRGTFEARVRQ